MALSKITTESLLDGEITTAKLADDQITLAKMAGGTDGQVITYDASGNPVAVGPGTDGQVLTSTGAGSPPAFEDAAGGGFIRLGGASFSGASSVSISPTGFDMDYAVSTGYDAYKLFFTCDNVNASERMYVTVSDNNASSFYDTGIYNYVGTGREGTGGWGSSEYAVSAFWIGGTDITSDNDADAIWHVEVTMIKPLAEAKSFAAHCIFGYYEGDNANANMNGGDMAWAAHGITGVDGLRLATNGGSNIHGYWTMYGLKSS